MAKLERVSEPQGWVVWLDSQITRRKRYHLVTDPSGEIVYRSMWLGECLAWLDLNDHPVYVLRTAIGRTLELPVTNYAIRKIG
tara:strand:- start:1119 stop:1367 length:249 start_codon:yes stop_codon:yes gene_type:complete